jgi:hypothetical protein
MKTLIHLRKSHRSWQVFCNVPRHLVAVVGRRQLSKSLGRVTLAEAKNMRWPIVRAMREEIAEADRRRRKELGAVGFVRVGEVHNYQGLIAALKLRRQQMGMTQLDLDDLAGLQSGYTGKIEAGIKGLAHMSLDCILGGLRVRLVVEGEPVNPLRAKLFRHQLKG